MASVTINSITYTVYANVATADDYFNGSLSSADWSALTADEKARALVTSTKTIDRQQWQGEKTDPLQELAFPRTGVVDCAGNDVTSAMTLTVVTEASILLALDIFTNSAVLTSVSTEDLTKRLKAGSVEIEKFRASSDSVSSGRFPLPVQELIGCYFSGRSSIAGALSYGTDGVAYDGDYSLNDGF